MEILKLMTKGFIVGLGKIIPGVSGGMLAMILKIYEPAVFAVSNFFSNWKKNSFFLGILGIGMICAVIIASGLIEQSLKYYYLPTMLLFIGLMLGGFPSLKKEVKGTNWKNYKVLLLFPFIIMLILEFNVNHSTFIFDKNIKDYLMVFFFGMIDAITMIVPGISGTAILILFGFYPVLLDTFSHLYDVSMLSTTLPIMIPFCLGIAFGAIITIKTVSYLLKHHSIKFYYVIMSFFISSILLLFLQTLKQNYTVKDIIIGIIFLVVGYFFSKKFDEYYNY